jgi:hypothetical protein
MSERNVREATSLPKHSLEKPKTSLLSTAPSVGFYKVSYAQIDKNVRVHNFQRSMPHFSRDRHFCNESSSVCKEIPESALCREKIKGFTELARMTSREHIRGAKVKPPEGPHESRFTLYRDFRTIDKSAVNMEKSIPRSPTLFARSEHFPNHDFSTQLIEKRLNTHILPFAKTMPRGDRSFQCNTGISDSFSQFEVTDERQR